MVNRSENIIRTEGWGLPDVFFSFFSVDLTPNGGFLHLCQIHFEIQHSNHCFSIIQLVSSRHIPSPYQIQLQKGNGVVKIKSLFKLSKISFSLFGLDFVGRFQNTEDLYLFPTYYLPWLDVKVFISLHAVITAMDWLYICLLIWGVFRPFSAYRADQRNRPW